MPDAVLHRWDALPSDAPAPGINRKFLTASRMTVARFALSRGAVVPSHAHEQEQVSYVVSGVLRFRAGGKQMDVRAGEVLQIPPGLEHAVEVLEDADVIDLFSPVRQDWIDGTDSYFKR